MKIGKFVLFRYRLADFRIMPPWMTWLRSLFKARMQKNAGKERLSGFQIPSQTKVVFTVQPRYGIGFERLFQNAWFFHPFTQYPSIFGHVLNGPPFSAEAVNVQVAFSTQPFTRCPSPFLSYVFLPHRACCPCGYFSTRSLFLYFLSCVLFYPV